MKSFKKLTFEQWYPTVKARTLADTVFDAMPLSTPIGEAIAVWELYYLRAGGIVKGVCL